jgi:hypothetical protein
MNPLTHESYPLARTWANERVRVAGNEMLKGVNLVRSQMFARAVLALLHVIARAPAPNPPQFKESQ